MAKGIIVVEIPECCFDCPFCRSSDKILIGTFEYRQLFSCLLEPENIEDAYLNDIMSSKPDWCPIRPMTEKRVEIDWYDRGWNDCVDYLEGRNGE